MKETSEEYMILFGKNLSRIRNLNGFSQRDMEDYGITRSYYGKLELGKHAITIDKLFLIARAFGININDLFLDEENKPL
jgi:transcriptional regulator with XRE-family HTH domain